MSSSAFRRSLHSTRDQDEMNWPSEIARSFLGFGWDLEVPQGVNVSVWIKRPERGGLTTPPNVLRYP